jgi:hypothetical protein
MQLPLTVYPEFSSTAQPDLFASIYGGFSKGLETAIPTLVNAGATYAANKIAGPYIDSGIQTAKDVGSGILIIAVGALVIYLLYKKG